MILAFSEYHYNIFKIPNKKLIIEEPKTGF